MLKRCSRFLCYILGILLVYWEFIERERVVLVLSPTQIKDHRIFLQTSVEKLSKAMYFCGENIIINCYSPWCIKLWIKKPVAFVLVSIISSSSSAWRRWNGFTKMRKTRKDNNQQNTRTKDHYCIATRYPSSQLGT